MTSLTFIKRSVIALSCALALSACEREKTFKVGVMAGEEAIVTEVAAKIAREKYNLKVELVTFNDYALPNKALSEKELDVNAFQHKPYLDQEIKTKGYQIVPVGNTFVFPIAAYSTTIKSINELKDGDTVVIPDDASNQGRALVLLESQGLIKLKDPKNIFATQLDIVANPKNLKIKPVAAKLTAQQLDEVPLAIVNGGFAIQHGLTLADHALFVEDKDSPYVNFIAARPDNKDSEAVKNFVKAFQTEQVYQEAQKQFKNGIVKGW